jgi:hypothetical protein
MIINKENFLIVGGIQNRKAPGMRPITGTVLDGGVL